MNESSDEQADPRLTMKIRGNPDPAEPGTDLKKEQDEIRNSKDWNIGYSTDFHDRMPPFLINPPKKAHWKGLEFFFRAYLRRVYSLAETLITDSPALPCILQLALALISISFSNLYLISLVKLAPSGLFVAE